MSNHYVEYVVRFGTDSVTCTNELDAYIVYNQWLAAGKHQGVILVRVDIHEEVLESGE